MVASAVGSVTPRVVSCEDWGPSKVIELVTLKVVLLTVVVVPITVKLPDKCTFPCLKQANCWDKWGVLYSCGNNKNSC